MFKKLLSKLKRRSRRRRHGGDKIAEAAGYSLMAHLTLTDFSERALLLQGRIAARSLPVGRPIRDLTEAEFRVFSQWGEDGIIEWLVSHVPVPNHRFVEFGVESFQEANCRFLMQNRNWRGLVIDGSEAHMASLRGRPLFWMHDLTAMAAFVSAENIDGLIAGAGFSGPLGILSIDIDGNDYWVWDAISCVDPAIVICEVNPILGDVAPITVPYDPDFTRFKYHSSGLYFGASVAAMQHLARKKGYTFLGTSLSGINAFFVRDDLAASVTGLLGACVAYPALHRDSRDADGNLSFAGGLARLDLIADLPVVDVVTGARTAIRDIDRIYSDPWLAAMT